MSPFLRILAVGLALVASAAAQLQPLVSGVQASQRAGTKLVDISYNIAYGGGPVTIWIEVSNDGGRSFIVPAKTFSGHIGQNVQPGTNRTVVWNAEADFDGMLAEQMRVRVNARAGNVPIPPQHMVYIPGGHFYMGEWDGGNAASARSVYVSPFFMDRYEVWGTFYREVREWAIARGYEMNPGNFREGNHPIQTVSWHDAVKWCNARSERENLIPVYYTDEGHANVYRSGSIELTNAMVKWNATGYRLPTGAEWEKGARGGLSGKTYPWGDMIDSTMATYGINYTAVNFSAPYPTTPVGYYSFSNGMPFESANGYGLYDVAGNVHEWCWEWETGVGIGYSDPKGPNTGERRAVRGGSWLWIASVGARHSELPATIFDSWHADRGIFLGTLGFRCAKGL